MGRKRDLEVRSMFTYDSTVNRSKCTFCKKIVNVEFLTNLKRHLKECRPLVYSRVCMKAKSLSDDNGNSAKRISLVISANNLRNNLINLVTKEGRPFNLLDSPSLRSILDPLYQGLQMNIINSHNISDVINERANEITLDITKTIKNKVISLKFDICTRLRKSVLGVNIQYIQEKTIVIKTLAMLELNKSHTAGYIKSEIESIMRKFEMKPSQIFTITTDNGRNVVKSVELLRETIQNQIDEGIFNKKKTVLF